jgi:hypothetical protein
VQALITAALIPVWVNLREAPLPALATLDSVLGGTRLDAARRVDDALSRGFFLRSVVLSPDGADILNPQDATPEGSWATWSRCGYFSYAQVHAADYRPMLEAALQQWRARGAATERPVLEATQAAQRVPRER